MKYLGDTQDEKSVIRKENLQLYVTNVSWDSANKKIQKTINGTISDVVTIPLTSGTGINSAVGGSINSTATGDYSFAFGDVASATGAGAIALGNCKASEQIAIAIGNKASGFKKAEASGLGSIAIGTSTFASNMYSTSIGYNCTASGISSLAVGTQAQATGQYAISIGIGSSANATASLALGWITKASSQYQTVMGKFNIEDDQDTYAFIIGNGTADNARSNAFTVDWNGNIAANNIVTKESLQNAGFYGQETYTTVCDTQTVTTTIHDKDNPWVILTGVEGVRSDYNDIYRVTFNGNTYILKSWKWFSSVWRGKSVSFIGNPTLWGDVQGYTGEYYDVPFLITGGMDSNIDFLSAEEQELIDYPDDPFNPLTNPTGKAHIPRTCLITSETGSYTVKLEYINYNYIRIPELLMYGVPHEPVQVFKDKMTTSYSGFSMGSNIMKQFRAAVAIGFNNTIDADSAKALGGSNICTGSSSIAIGIGNEVQGQCSNAFGRNCVSSAIDSIAIGYKNKAIFQYQAVVGLTKTTFNKNKTKYYYLVDEEYIQCTSSSVFNSSITYYTKDTEGSSCLGCFFNTASGYYATTVGGYNNNATGMCSISMGNNNESSGTISFTCGVGLKANRLGNFVIGTYNEEDIDGAVSSQGNYAFIISKCAPSFKYFNRHDEAEALEAVAKVIYDGE